MEINKDGLWKRLYMIIIAVYFLTVGSCGANNYYQLKSIESEFKAGTVFGRYVPLTSLEKANIGIEILNKTDECKKNSEERVDLFCMLEAAQAPKYKKVPNFIAIGLALVLPFVLWLILRLIERLGRWTLTGK